MYKQIFLILALAFFMFENLLSDTSLKVSSVDELQNAIKAAKAGDEIVLANGVWNDIEIQFTGKGTKDKPITLRAETPGEVFIEGQSSLKIGGEYLIVDGLYFRNGYTPSRRVIDFKIDRRTIANHSKLINCVIEDFTNPDRHETDLWVEFSGRHNQVDHCYFAGKTNRGPTLRVNLRGNEHIRNYHQVTNNYFGPRPRRGGPTAETIQIGSSGTSMTPAYVNVSNNFFDRCNGEVEVISSKSNFNTFRNNIFYKCEGSLVTRHGNYCTIDGNFFIGDEDSDFYGGIRIINTGHWVTNNYFYKINGDEFRAPLAIMNGIRRSPRNRYHQVTDAVVAYNTWIDCESPWQISVGANVDKKDVLPASEIRSERPARTVVANNIIYSHNKDSVPIKAYDKIDGITFRNNLINNELNDSLKFDGIATKVLKMKEVSDWLYLPLEINDDMQVVYSGFGFEDIQMDVFGNSRADGNAIGAISRTSVKNKMTFDKSQYGPSWFSAEKTAYTPKVIDVSHADGEIHKKLAQANDGDILALSSGTYNIEKSLAITKKVTIKPKENSGSVELIYSGSIDSPAFQINPKGTLVLEKVTLKATGEQYAFAPLQENMTFGYNLFVRNSQIENFKNILLAYKGSFADTISFSNTEMKNCGNGFVLASEDDAKGSYNAEFVNFHNCKFENIPQNVIHFYRGGYDESTIGGVLSVKNSQFTNCGKDEGSSILLKTHGIINVDISKNTFKNNAVKYVAVLWGEKNNEHSENEIVQSGEILVEEHLKQKLLY